MSVCAQEPARIETLLSQIRVNNPELAANSFDAEARMLADRMENNLSDPTVSYSHLWGEKNSRETIGELVVSQQFDFPTLYAARSRTNRLKANALAHETDLLRQQILLRAQELCIDLLMYQQQRDLLNERLQQAEMLVAFYKQRLETGDANILETNKTALELLNARTELRNVQVATDKAWSELNAINGNKDWVGGTPAGIADYPLPPLPDEQAFRDEYLATSSALRQLDTERAAAYRQLAVDKQGWLPKLELGYRRNTESKLGFSGIVAGISLPLFSNRHKVKMAEVQWLALGMQRNNVEAKSENELEQLYNEATTLRTAIREYHEALQTGSNLELLRQAIEGGQINVTEYFVEVSVVYQGKQNLLELENKYRKIIARMYMNTL
jgi:outer membrane protein TolC